MALDELKRHEEAMNCYDKSIEIDPNYFEACQNKGIDYQILRIYIKSIEKT